MTNNDKKRLLVAGGWEHIFSDGKVRDTRWVWDTAEDRIVAAQVRYDGRWEDATEDAVADLEDSIDSNEEFLTDPQEYGLEFRDELPEWDN
jgi:hypothetical protein